MALFRGKDGGRILTEEEQHYNVVRAMALEEKKELRRLGRDFEDGLIDAVDNVCGDDGKPLPDMEAVVLANKTSATNSLSQTEWLSMEAAMPAEERLTHRNLSIWMAERAKAHGVAEAKEDDDDDDDDPEMLALLQEGLGDAPEGGEDSGGEEEEKADQKKKEKELEEEKEVGTIDKQKNWSSVNIVCKESKMTFRGTFSQTAFTNWLWYRVIRPKLEETKSKLPELDDDELAQFLIDDGEEVLGEFMPVVKKKDEKDKKDKKDDKKDKKDDKKDKKDDKDDKKDKKDDKKDKKDDKKSGKKKKDIVTLTAKEKIQAQHLVKDMIYGLDGKTKTIVCGWINMVDEKDIPTLTPWEFQIAHCMRICMELEYASTKKSKTVDTSVFYEIVQSLADAIGMLRKQYKHEFPEVDPMSFLPLRDALTLQQRVRDGSVQGVKFDIMWYLQFGAHLLAGSKFAQKHRTTVFKPFKIQELVVDAIVKKGPQLVFAIAPPGTGKTAIVSHVLGLFPAHTLVFCCAAMPVVLGVGRISNSLGVPYAFVKGRRITPSYSCGRGLATHVDGIHDFGDGEEARWQTAIDSLKYTVAKLNLERKKKRLAEKKRKRILHDLKRFPRMFLMCDTASCAWLLRQLDPNRTILVVDEPPMGSDTFAKEAADNPLACAMSQCMMTPTYKTLWMSATLPRVDALPTLVNGFLDRFKLDRSLQDKHVSECFSTELDRGAVMCGPSGAVAFPHQSCETADKLAKLCKRLPADPLVLKAYTERALAGLLQRWNTLTEAGKIKDTFSNRTVGPSKKFEDLSDLNHASIRSYALELLECVAAEQDDQFTKDFCEAGGQNEKGLFPEYNLDEMLFANAYAFPGLTLVADDNPCGRMKGMAVKLEEAFASSNMKNISALEGDIKTQEAATTKAGKFAEDDEQQTEGPQAKLRFDAGLVIQSEQFLKRWCPNRPDGTHHIVRILPTVKEFLVIKDLPVTEDWQMLALAGAGSFDPKLDNDPSNPVYTQWVHDNMTKNKLACVTAGKEFTWGANVPASTIVVTRSFAETTSVAGMLQYVGRAARRGLTTHGQAIFERTEDLERIFASPDGLSTEAVTMEKYAKWWLSRGKVWS